MRAPERLASATEGKYEFLGVGAVGGMGEVYAVRHRLLGELRAVKVMGASSRLNPQLQERFLLEARIAARLRHPNLVQLHDLVFHDNGTAYMVLEWIEGLDLARVLEQYGPPAIEDALEIARQALSALAYIHRQGIVHRDISTDNLMVVERDDHELQVKIIDLGIAKSINTDSGLTRKGLFVGKLRYASPEALDTRHRPATPDPRSDLYSFGVVLYEILTGARPITGSSESELLSGHLLQPPRPFAETDPEGRVPGPLREIVLKCLEKAPEDRFQSAAELARALDALEPPRRRPGQREELRRAIALATTAAAELARSEDLDRQEREFHRALGSAESATPGMADAPTLPAHPDREGSAEREVWFEELRRKMLDGRSPSAASTVVKLIQTHPRPVAAGVAAIVLLLVIGFSGFLRGGEGPGPGTVPAPEASLGRQAPPPSAPQQAAEPEPPREAEATDPAGPAADTDSRPPAAGRTVVVVSDDAQLTGVVVDRLRGVAEVMIRTSLEDALGAGRAAGGARLAVTLSATTQSGALEAYDTLIPTCRVAVSGQLLALPRGSSLFARTVESTAPRCREAVAQAGGRLADELAAAIAARTGAL